MSKLRIEILTPPSPYQTYLEERLQSARGLGWTYTAPAQPAPAVEPVEPALVIVPQAQPA